MGAAVVMSTIYDDVDRVRLGEHRSLKRVGDERRARSKYLWLSHVSHGLTTRGGGWSAWRAAGGRSPRARG